MSELKKCYNCGASPRKLIHIKNFMDYHMIKCGRCVINVEGFMIHPIEGGNTYEEAVATWNSKLGLE